LIAGQHGEVASGQVDTDAGATCLPHHDIDGRIVRYRTDLCQLSRADSFGMGDDDGVGARIERGLYELRFDQ
jgi:hypothetical protein